MPEALSLGEIKRQTEKETTRNPTTRDSLEAKSYAVPSPRSGHSQSRGLLELPNATFRAWWNYQTSKGAYREEVLCLRPEPTTTEASNDAYWLLAEIAFGSGKQGQEPCLIQDQL